MMRGEAPPTVNAVMAVTTPSGATTTITPTLRVAANQALQGDPVPVPGGATLTLTNVDPTNQFVTVQLGGIDLSKVDPNDLKSRVFIDISIEPAIKFAWGGIIIGVLGGLLALLRRWREARPAADAPLSPVPIPTEAYERPALQPAMTPITRTESEARS
jgi:cytochrome c-type biogenesis protein CcmF